MPEPLLISIWIKLRNRIVNRGFVVYELLMARLSRTPKLRILISNVKRSRATIAHLFRFTPHEIHFDEFRPDTVAGFDVLVSLTVGDTRRLDEMRALIGYGGLPVPSRNAIDTCDDKLVFYRRMVAAGLADRVPRVDDSLAPPYVLKNRHGAAGYGVELVIRESDARSAGQRRLRRLLPPGAGAGSL